MEINNITMKHKIINSIWLLAITITLFTQNYHSEKKIKELIAEDLNQREANLVDQYQDKLSGLQSLITRPDYVPKKPKTIKDVIDILNEISNIDMN